MPGAEHPHFTADELNHLFAPVSGEHAIALAVSGGSDSLALMHLAARWAGELPPFPPPSPEARPRRNAGGASKGGVERGTAVPHSGAPFEAPALRASAPQGSGNADGRSKSGPALVILTVDHGLRPESAREAKQVAQWAAALGHRHAILRWEGEKPSTGIPAKARAARYRLLADWCERQNIRVLMTGHTRDDQAETVIMRIARGTSIEGLIGIHSKVRLSPSVSLHRPFLDVSRARLRAFLMSLGPTWIDDPSNHDERFERVRVRRLMPALAGIGVSAENLSLLASRAREAHFALCEATTQYLARFSEHYPEGYCTIVRADYDVLTEEAKLRVLERQIALYGGGNKIERNEIELLSASLSLGRNTRRTLGGAVIATRTRHLLIGREPGRIDPLPRPLVDGMSWDRRFKIGATRTDGLQVAPANVPLSRRIRNELPGFVYRSLPAIFDRDRLIAIPSIGLGETGFAAEWRHAPLLSDP